MILDIETLRLIWWVLLGVLFMGFAVMDGFDMGAAILSPLVARNDDEQRVVLNTIGAVWEGNQVWIILGAGAIFAAWPLVYAVAFSVAYLAVLLLLLTMGISRPVSFKYRSKLPNHFWRRCWDWVVFAGGFFPALIFGILVGNVLIGLPFYFDNDLRIHATGTFWQLFNPFALWCGLVSLSMLVMHGGLFLATKTFDPIRGRALAWSRIAACMLIVTFAIGGFWMANSMGYQVVSAVDPYGYSNPLHKQVIILMGGWLNNYKLYPIAMAVPALGFIGALLVIVAIGKGKARLAFICSALSEIGVIGTVGVSMFPFILPSSANFGASLLVWDASSSHLTLLVMLFATAIFLPIVMMYTAWVYRVMRGPVTSEIVKEDQQAY